MYIYTFCDNINVESKYVQNTFNCYCLGILLYVNSNSQVLYVFLTVNRESNRLLWFRGVHIKKYI